MAMRRSQKSCNVATQVTLKRETINKLFRAKMDYGQLFLFRHSGKIFTFRPLVVKEMETIVALSTFISDTAIEDWIIETTFIGEEEDKNYLLNKTPFKYLSFISEKITFFSSIQKEDEYKTAIIDSRNKLNTVQNVVERIICKGYNSYNHESVKNMTQRRQLEILAKAESIAEEQLTFDDKKKNKKALRKFAEGASVIGAEDITSPLVADKPDFNERF